MPSPRPYHVKELLREHESQGRAYLEFLREPAMSASLYILAAHAEGTQLAYTEAEIHVVVNGRGQIRLGSEDRPVVKGSIVYVPANTEHRVLSIEQTLEILVLFAPAEGSVIRRAGPRA